MRESSTTTPTAVSTNNNTNNYCVCSHLRVEEQHDPLALVIVRADVHDFAVDDRLRLEAGSRFHDVGGRSGVAEKETHAYTHTHTRAQAQAQARTNIFQIDDDQNR